MVSLKNMLVIGACATLLVPFAAIAANKTTLYVEKQGFHRDAKDILNTLRNNEVSQFQNTLDALQQAFDLDRNLKEGGPYTFFAAPDNAYKKLSTEDFQSLFNDKKRLRQLMGYDIVPGKVSGAELRTIKSLKTLDGQELRVSTKASNVYVNDILISTSDIQCTNGVIHVIEKIMMPPPSR